MADNKTPLDICTVQERVSAPEFVEWLNGVVVAYSQNPWDEVVLADLRRARAQLTECLLSTPEDNLPQLLSNQLAKLHLSMAGGGLRDLPLSEDEQVTFDHLLSAFKANMKQAVPPGHLLAVMLYCRPDHPTIAFLDRPVPDWLVGVFTAYLVIEPVFFTDAAQATQYYEFIQQAVRYVHNIVYGARGDAGTLCQKARISAHTYATFSCHIQPYFGFGDLRDFSEKRAYVLTYNARASGLSLDWIPPTRIPGQKKIRIGVLNPHFASKTETFATLPVFEHLDRKRFEICLYVTETAHSPLERYCASRVDRMLLLPKNPPEQASILRKERLDILFFGSNLTAGVDTCATLALHRLAPVQIASICCPVTTGFRYMDYYLAGDLLAPAGRMQPQFSEKLLNIPGSGICFSFGPQENSATQPISRQQLGIPDTAVVFISGSNYFKISPEVRETWATIVARVPGSVLVLYPFNPNWSSRYNAGPFVSDIKQRFAQHGLSEDQLKILDPLPTRADIKELLGLADVYLDSYPYGGATSLIDTLETGLPPIVIEGDMLRFRQAPAMLRELSVPELITDSEAAYIELACRLGQDTEFRQQLRDKIQSKMKKRPAFLDSRGFAKNLEKQFKILCRK